MFTTYIKNLNDMVFSTADSPEQQPTTGVLGRIGSWFSPWRGKDQTSPTENASPTGIQPLVSDGEYESEESVKPTAGEQQWGEECSNPSSLGLARDIFLYEEQDATQSGHKHSSVVSSTETRQGAPKEEESVVCRKKRIGQDQEWEENGNGTSVSGNAEKNASHLTHLSAFSKQGVVWDSDQAHTQPQAQTGKRLRVYLEETSVTHCGQDTCVGQEVVRTEVTKSLKVLSKAKSSLGFDSSKSSSATNEENKGLNVRPVVGAQSYYSTLAGVSLKSQKDSQLEPETYNEQTETDSMGRKNSGARRRHRKNSQGDGGNSPREKMPPTAQPPSEGFPSMTNPPGKSPQAHMGESSVSSASKHNPTSQVSPEGVESKTCPDTVKQLDNFQDSNSVSADTPACGVDGGADMEDDDSFYKVERKTETPESKRRSIKVSQSEVKFFTKNVPLTPKPAESNREFKLPSKNAKDEEEDKHETDARPRDLKKTRMERKPVVGRIADKISLFESPERGHKQIVPTTRSADVSPTRKAPERVKADLSDQRSSYAEDHGTVRSSSTSPVKSKLMSIKERAKNFTGASLPEDKPAEVPKPAMTEKSQKPPAQPVEVSMSESANLDSQGKQDTKEAIETAVAKITSKPDGPDTSIAKRQQSTDSKITNTVASKTESGVLVKGTDDSSEIFNSISPQSKGPSKTGARPKRRKSKEPMSPVSPNSENKPTRKLEVTALKQEQVVDTAEAVPASKQPTGKVSSNKIQIKASGVPLLSDTKERPFKEESGVFDKPEKQADSTFKKENIDKSINRQNELPDNTDEPDTGACNTGTKSVDKVPIVLHKKVDAVRGQGTAFTQESEMVSKDSRETPATFPSPVDERPIDNTPTLEQDPPVKHCNLEELDLSIYPESKSNKKARQPSEKDPEQTLQTQNNDTQAMNETGSKDVAENKLTNQTEIEDKDQPLCSNTNSGNGKDLDNARDISGTRDSVGKSNVRRTKDKTQLIKDLTKPEARKEEAASQSPEKTSGSSGLCAQTHHVSQPVATHPDRAAVCAVTQTNEVVCGTECDKGLLKAEAATNVPPELQTKSTESPRREKKHVVSAAQPQPNSVSVEKTENSPDDSHTHGAHDDFSGSKPITKATTAVGEVTVKAANDTPVLITAQTDNMGAKESSVKGPTPVSVSKSASSEEAGQDDGERNSAVKSVLSDVNVSGGTIKLAPSHPQSEESKEKTVSTSDTTSPKGAGKTARCLSDSSAAKSTADAIEKTTANELSPVVNSDIALHPVKKEPVSKKPSQTPKGLTSPEAYKTIPDLTQHSSMKKLNFPRVLNKDENKSSQRQDAVSSYLDVDIPKKKLKVPEPKLSLTGSESNLLDTPGELDDDDFVEKIKKLCAPFSFPPRKHNHLRPPQPPFAMPAIKEVRFEKTFDPKEFKIGLRKNNQFTLDTAPTLQSKETKSGLKPARASLADRSMLLSSLDTHSRLRENNPVTADENKDKEDKDDQIKVKSRLEGSCVFSSLTSSSVRGKRNGLQTQVDSPGSGDVSPSEAHVLSLPPSSQPTLLSPAATGPINGAPAKQSPASNNTEEAQAVEVVVCDSGPPLPSFNDIKLPDYLEKYLPREPGKSAQCIQGQEPAKKEVNGKLSTPVPEGEADPTAKPGPLVPKVVSPCVPGFPPNTHAPAPDLKQPPAQPQVLLSKTIRTVKGFHKRPGKMVLFEKAQFSGQSYEIYRDVADATSLQLSPLISVKVVRGCWILYEKPGFEGRSIALEEGDNELTNLWAESELDTEPLNNPPMLIGSIRLVVSDYSIPHIDLFTEQDGHGRVTPYHDDTIETGSFGIPLSTASIQVHSGVWLVFSDPGFQGMLAVLETGVYPFPETWGFSSPFVGSLRPLRMGGLKVENPSEVKAVVYEKPCFEGFSLEIDSDVFSFGVSGEDIATDEAFPESKKLKTVGSLKIIGGLWVGYSQPGFEGQQHILEEGEYLDCSDWGGSEQLLSLRPILANFVAPHLKMFTDRDFGELGVSIDITGPVNHMEDTGYGVRTQSIEVMGGVWVVFEEPGFCGESYILEKGLYGSPEDWGALQPRVASALPVLLDDIQNASKFKVQLFSDPGFQGSVLPLEDSVASLQDGFSVASCKVLAGSWLAFEGQEFTDRTYVLEEGSYPDLRAMGFDSTSSSIQSLQTVGFEFSLPSITLFERGGLRGKRVVLTDGSVNLQLAGGCSRVQSVLVEGAMWILYERINYQGTQILLKPGEIPDWRKFSSLQKIGSLRPLIQKEVHFRLRNRQTGLMMSVTGSLDEVKLMRIQETEETDGFEQVWFYQNGHLHCKMLEEYCLSPSSSVTMAGSRVGLSPEPDMHLWSLTPQGFIRYTSTSDLVLDVKGGQYYDKNQVILNSLDPNKLQQRWNVEII